MDQTHQWNSSVSLIRNTFISEMFGLIRRPISIKNLPLTISGELEHNLENADGISYPYPSCHFSLTVVNHHHLCANSLVMSGKKDSYTLFLSRWLDYTILFIVVSLLWMASSPSVSQKKPHLKYIATVCLFQIASHLLSCAWECSEYY